jgi:hypothetical protein
MARRIVYTRPDGGVSVVCPAPHLDTPETIDFVAVDAIAKAGLPPTPYEVIDHTELPPTRRWRNAWRRVGRNVAADIVEARRIRRAELMERRDRLVERVRQKVAEGQEDGIPALQIAALRAKAKELRGVDGTIDTQLAGVATLAALHTFEPSEFSGV